MGNREVGSWWGWLFSLFPTPYSRLPSHAMIEPRRLKGFHDYLPEVMMPREELLDKVRRVYRSYGYAPIDTPALEYLEILRGKGGEESDKLIYNFRDRGDRE